MIFPWKRKKNLTIFQEFLEWEKSGVPLEDWKFVNKDLAADDGARELAFLQGTYRGVTPDTDLLDAHIMGYFSRETDSPAKIEEYFKTRRVLDVANHFRHWAYMGEGMVDPPFKGLSLYLMQQGREPETVKFGIFLGEFYDVVGTPAALRTIALLGKWPGFTHYAVDVLKYLPKGMPKIYEISKDTFGNGKKCIAAYVEERLNIKERP